MGETHVDFLEKLRKVWGIVKWLDDARWATASSSSLIPGPVFASLKPDKQILAHWLSYITDQQRPWEEVWRIGGPIFAEAVREYQDTASKQYVLNLLMSFTVESEKPGGVDTFKSKQQKVKGGVLSYTPRFGSHLLSIAITLYVLSDYYTSIANYLADNSAFMFKPARHDDDSPVARMSFLLYTLSYYNIQPGTTSVHSQSFARAVEQAYSSVKYLLLKKDALEDEYFRWLRQKRFHKRLWAAFRDYIKPGSCHESIFLNSLDIVNAKAITDFLKYDRSTALSCLELPGDTWNLKFTQYMFGNRINHPKELREYYKQLRDRGYLTEQFYPEQFDMSFDFAPRMCDRGEESLCPFRHGTKLLQYCFGQEGKDKKCPLTIILCGYETCCISSECPILTIRLEDLCSGCAPKTG